MAAKHTCQCSYSPGASLDLSLPSELHDYQINHANRISDSAAAHGENDRSAGSVILRSLYQFISLEIDRFVCLPCTDRFDRVASQSHAKGLA